MFNRPAEASGFFTPRNHLGNLILITKVHERRRRFDELKNGEVDEAIVDLVDLDGDRVLQESVVLSHPGIVSRVRGLDANILGRIGTVPSSKGNPAFVLNDFEDADVAAATAWVNEQNAFHAPAQAAAPASAPAPAPAPAPVAAAPAAPAASASETAKELLAAGLGIDEVVAATGLAVNVVAILANAVAAQAASA